MHHRLAFLWILLAGCSDPGTRTGVRGRVLGAGGESLPGATVLVSGRFVQTDKEGTFTVDPVSVPYDVAVAGYLRVVVYRGVTARNIVLRPPYTSAGPRTALVSGRVLGANPSPDTPLTSVQLAWGPEGSGLAGTADPAGVYTLPVAWGGPAAPVGAVHALQLRGTPPDGEALEFLGYGQSDVSSLQDRAALVGLDVTLQPVETGHLLGTLGLPSPEWAMPVVQVTLTLADGTGMPLPQHRLDAGTFALAVPVMPGLRAAVMLSLKRPGQRNPLEDRTESAYVFLSGLRPGESLPEPRFREAATLLEPAPGASLDGGAFRWAPAGQLSQFSVFDGLHRLEVWTTAASTPLPDLSLLGFSLQEGATWDVWSTEVDGGVDALLGSGAPQFPWFAGSASRAVHLR